MAEFYAVFCLDHENISLEEAGCSASETVGKTIIFQLVLKLLTLTRPGEPSQG